ncbi:MAG: hypothetical protein H6747_16585 [Deltaproteobacteria bacterium]|nr:hypothetical protein [Deltaproteobacteria bacterium]
MALPPRPAAPAVEVVRLAVPGYGEAVYRAPREGRGLPLVIALHSSADRPEWMCRHLAAWAAPAPDQPGGAVLLCPAGTPRRDVSPADPRWGWGDPAATAAEVEAARAALLAALGDRVAQQDATLVGFSLGGSRAAVLAVCNPARYPRLLLWEGGAPQLRGRPLRRYLAAGGMVAVGCSEARCRGQAAGICAGVSDQRCHTFSLDGIGHSVEAPFAEAARPHWLRLLGTTTAPRP